MHSTCSTAKCFHLTVIRIKAENEGTKTIFSLVVLSDFKAYTVLFILDRTLPTVYVCVCIHICAFRSHSIQDKARVRWLIRLKLIRSRVKGFGLMFCFSSNNYFAPNDTKIGIKESRGSDITVNVLNFMRPRIIFYQLETLSSFNDVMMV